MASRKQKKANAAPATDPAAATDEQKSAARTASTTKKAAKKAGDRRTATKRRGPGRPKGSKTKRRAANKPAAKKSGRPRRYTPAERAKILAAAKREGLSGPAAAEKFGISQLTFYTWRKKAGVAKTRRVGRPKRTRTDSGAAISRGIDGVLRQEIRARIGQMLPEIIRGEIDSILGHSVSRRRAR